MDRDTDALLIYHEDICVCVHIELLSQNDILTVWKEKHKEISRIVGMIAITKDFPVLERLTMEIVTPFVDLLNSAQVPSTTDLYL